MIRRHPDIKRLRRPDDIAALSALQARLLAALWPLLAPGGRLVYVTCSVLPEENHLQLARWLETAGDAAPESLDADWGRPAPVGRQILTGADGMDGFYYASVRKLP